MKCCNTYQFKTNIVAEHLICKDFNPTYTNWIFHGEGDIDDDGEDVEKRQKYDVGINTLLYDTFRDVERERISERPIINNRKFYNLLKEVNQELYSCCKTFSKLSFIIQLYLIKCENRLNNTLIN